MSLILQIYFARGEQGEVHKHLPQSQTLLYTFGSIQGLGQTGCQLKVEKNEQRKVSNLGFGLVLGNEKLCYENACTFFPKFVFILKSVKVGRVRCLDSVCKRCKSADASTAGLSKLNQTAKA